MSSNRSIFLRDAGSALIVPLGGDLCGFSILGHGLECVSTCNHNLCSLLDATSIYITARVRTA